MLHVQQLFGNKIHLFFTSKEIAAIIFFWPRELKNKK